MLNKFNKEKAELNNQIKLLNNRVKFSNIDKEDEIRKYENLVGNLSERLYKLEGKKYCYTKKHTFEMKTYDRAKSLGKNDSINRLASKAIYKKGTIATNKEEDFMEEIQKTYEDNKDQIKSDKSDKEIKRYNSSRKERSNKAASENEIIFDEINRSNKLSKDIT